MHFVNTHIKEIVITTLFLLVGQVLYPQSQQEDYFSTTIEKRSLDREKWETLKKQVDYDKDVFKRKKRKANRDNDANLNSFAILFGIFWKAAVIIVAIILLVILLNQFLGNYIASPSDKKIDTASSIEYTDIEQIEANLDQVDLLQMINDAIKNGDFKMAIRLHYLRVLQTLKQQKIIKWKKDKTNKEYLKEVKHTSYFTPFKKLTSIFERVWYGNQKKVDMNTYNEVEDVFNGLMDELDKKPD